MFDNILVPLDLSVLAECVLPHAVAIARAFQSHVTLFNVLERSSGPDCSNGVDPFERLLRKAEAESYLRSVADRFPFCTLAMNLIIFGSSHGLRALDGTTDVRDTAWPS